MNRRDREQRAALIAQLADAQTAAKFWQHSAANSEAARQAAERELIAAHETICEKSARIIKQADQIQALTFESNNLLVALTETSLPDLAGPIARTQLAETVAPIYAAAVRAAA